MNDKAEFEKKITSVLAESVEIDYPANLHNKIMHGLESEVSAVSGRPINMFSYGFAFACVFILIAYSAFYFLALNTSDLDNNIDKPGVIVTNMNQGDLEDVTEEDIKQFFVQLKKYNEQQKSQNSNLPENSVPEAFLASDR